MEFVEQYRVLIRSFCFEPGVLEGVIDSHPLGWINLKAASNQIHGLRTLFLPIAITERYWSRT